MIACDGACIPDGGVHAPLLCPNVVASREASVGSLRRNVTRAPSATLLRSMVGSSRGARVAVL